jgi:hypothetical protein
MTSSLRRLPVISADFHLTLISSSNSCEDQFREANVENNVFSLRYTNFIVEKKDMCAYIRKEIH